MGILSTYVGQNGFNIKNSREFINALKNIKIDKNDEICSLDVISLYTRIPIPLALTVLKEKLVNDKNLRKRTQLNINTILELSTLCLTNTYFKYDDLFYKQQHGLAMGNPLSSIIANLVMENIEEKIMNTPILKVKIKFWNRFVDDIFVVKKKDLQNEIILDIANSINKEIQFTYEHENERKLPFLDILVERRDQEFFCKLYQKPTHAKSYLNFDSAHHNSVKLGIVKTLKFKIEEISDQPDLDKEKIKNQLKNCNYPKNLIQNIFSKQLVRNINPDKLEFKNILTLPYVKKISETTKRQLKKLNVNLINKSTTTLKNLLIKNRPMENNLDKTGVVYNVKCECNKNYIGQTKRALKIRLKEHEKCIKEMNMFNGIAKHVWESKGHNMDFKNTKILCKEKNWFRRNFKESALIKNKGDLNLDTGPFDVKIWGNFV